MKRRIIAALLAAALFCAGCVSEPETITETEEVIMPEGIELESEIEDELIYEPEPEPIIPEIPIESEDLTLRGNTTGNSINLGTAVFDGEWIYYFNGTRNRNLYKIRNDGTEKTLISGEIIGQGINVLDGWIYYLGFHEEEIFIDYDSNDGYWLLADVYAGIFKCRTDGTEITLLSTDYTEILSVVGDWIYYINRFCNTTDTYEDFIYKMRLDGTERTLINNARSSSINVVGDWIYYVETRKDNFGIDEIYKIRTDGTEKELIVGAVSDGDSINRIIVSDGWIYYNHYYFIGDGNFFNSEFYREFNKIRTDGSEKTLLSDRITNFTVEGDWIYFSEGVLYDEINHFHRDNIHKMRTDGTNESIISESDYIYMVFIPNIAGYWIYFRDFHPQKIGSTRRINIQGGELELVE